MARANKRVRRELVESELLERAAELFAERGFNGTTLQDVADTVGLTRAALYHYFDSKEALLTTLVEGITAARAAELKRIRRDTALSAKEKLAQATRAMVVSVATQAARFRLLTENESELPPALAALQARGRREVLKHLVQLFEEGMQAGELRVVDPYLGAFAVLGMCNWVAWWFQPGRNQPMESVAEQFADVALAAFATTDAASGHTDDLHATIRRLREDLRRLDRLMPAK